MPCARKYDANASSSSSVQTPLGPMRLTSAYNAYGRPRGPLYRIDDQTNTLVREGEYGGKRAGGSFFSHLQWHFSVGLAF